MGGWTDEWRQKNGLMNCMQMNGLHRQMEWGQNDELNSQTDI